MNHICQPSQKNLKRHKSKCWGLTSREVMLGRIGSVGMWTLSPAALSPSPTQCLLWGRDRLSLSGQTSGDSQISWQSITQSAPSNFLQSPVMTKSDKKYRMISCLAFETNYLHHSSAGQWAEIKWSTTWVCMKGQIFTHFPLHQRICIIASA